MGNLTHILNISSFVFSSYYLSFVFSPSPTNGSTVRDASHVHPHDDIDEINETVLVYMARLAKPALLLVRNGKRLIGILLFMST